MSDEPILAALARLESGQQSLQSGQQRLQSDVQTLHSGQQRLESEFTSTRVELMSRMDRLQDSLTAIRDDIAVNMGAADAMQRANDNTRELVRSQGEQMSVIWRQLKALQERVRSITGDP